MAVKFTMLFQGLSNSTQLAGVPSRIGGWTETWYNTGTSIPDTITLARNSGIQARRSALLPNGAVIIGQRFQVVDPRGPAQSTSEVWQNATGQAQDIPQMGLLISVPALAVGNIRKQIIRSVPDVNVVEGEYQPSVLWRNNVQLYFDSLATWRFRGRDLTQTAFAIISINSAGLVTTQLAHGYALNDRVRILRTLTAAGPLAGGLFYVATVPSTTTFTLNTWPHGSTTGGTVRREVIIYPQVNRPAITIGRIVTRRVGRPFVQYRGRRGRRR